MDYVFKSRKKSVFGSLEKVCPCLKEKENNTASLQQREEWMHICVCSFQLKNAWEADGPT